ncbi:MAG: AAA family ATPase [Cyanobacteria bacterium P01_F01_bin.150]
MLNSLNLRNLTVFAETTLQFSPTLNVIVGENGTGKTHLLKIVYASLASSWQEGRSQIAGAKPTKAIMQSRLADKLVKVFRPESLGRLTRRKQGRERCDVKLRFEHEPFNMAFSFATNSKTEVSLDQLPEEWVNISPAYIPTHELLSLYPNFVSIYEGRYLEFEETWRDTCLLLGSPLQRGPKEKRIQELLTPLEAAMGGSIELDKNGRFYLKGDRGRFEMPLVAEGQRKLATIARLVATGALLDQGFLFWDEPESNLNPRLVKQVARAIMHLSQTGIQIFFATHSLFLLREIEILMADVSNAHLNPRFFGLQPSADSVMITQGNAIDEIGDIVTLDEELAQSDRYLDSEV